MKIQSDGTQDPFAGMPYRLALNRDEAAFHIHVALPTWNRLVAEGVIPAPKMIGPRYLWDRREIELAFANLPSGGAALAEETDDGWKWRARSTTRNATRSEMIEPDDRTIATPAATETFAPIWC